MANAKLAAIMAAKKRKKDAENAQKDFNKDVEENKIPNVPANSVENSTPPKNETIQQKLVRIRRQNAEKKLAQEQGNWKEKVGDAKDENLADFEREGSSVKVSEDFEKHHTEISSDSAVIPIHNPAEQKHTAKGDVTFDMLNEQQKRAVSLARNGENFVLTGAAGTGKTTTQKMVIQALLETNQVTPIKEETKWLKQGSPAIAIVSFTNVAVKNIAEVVPEELKDHCVTVHKLLEFFPEKYADYVETPEGDIVEVMKQRFVPQRTKINKLSNLQLVIIEEASNVGKRLYEQLVEACPSYCRFIFLGDINQLKPVGDDGILGFKLSELPIVELTEVHRQAAESKILSFAHKILSGIPPVSTDYMIKEYKRKDELEFIKFKKRIDGEDMMPILGQNFSMLAKAGTFVPNRDMILCPFARGGDINTNEINKYIAQAFSEMRDENVWEIFAGRNKVYLAIGDTVYVQKESWTITDIVKNPGYAGKPTRLPSKTMDRWGDDPNEQQGDMLDILTNTVPRGTANMEEEEIKNQASHIVYLENVLDPEITTDIHTAGDFGENAFSFGYALTVHKAQGSEWKNVYLVLHHSHAVSSSRELLYTAVTRAREKLTIMFDDGKHKFDSTSILSKGIKSSQIKGNTLEAKIAYFREKIDIQERAEKLKNERLATGKEIDEDENPQEALKRILDRKKNEKMPF